jgi:hypothetical protein
MFVVNRRMYCYNNKEDFDDYLNYFWCEDLEEYNEILTIENSM